MGSSVGSLTKRRFLQELKQHTGAGYLVRLSASFGFSRQFNRRKRYCRPVTRNIWINFCCPFGNLFNPPGHGQRKYCAVGWGRVVDWWEDIRCR